MTIVAPSSVSSWRRVASTKRLRPPVSPKNGDGASDRDEAASRVGQGGEPARTPGQQPGDLRGDGGKRKRVDRAGVDAAEQRVDEAVDDLVTDEGTEDGAGGQLLVCIASGAHLQANLHGRDGRRGRRGLRQSPEGSETARAENAACLEGVPVGGHTEHETGGQRAQPPSRKTPAARAAGATSPSPRPSSRVRRSALASLRRNWSGPSSTGTPATVPVRILPPRREALSSNTTSASPEPGASEEGEDRRPALPLTGGAPGTTAPSLACAARATTAPSFTGGAPASTRAAARPLIPPPITTNRLADPLRPGKGVLMDPALDRVPCRRRERCPE